MADQYDADGARRLVGQHRRPADCWVDVAPDDGAEEATRSTRGGLARGRVPAAKLGGGPVRRR